MVEITNVIMQITCPDLRSNVWGHRGKHNTESGKRIFKFCTVENKLLGSLLQEKGEKDL